VATKNNVTLGQAANFKVNLRNNSNEPRTYTLGVKTGSLPNNFEVKANGLLLTLPVSTYQLMIAFVALI
jgi:hypothetical protein